MKKLLNFKRVDIDFSSHQRYWENFEQENYSIAINVLFAPHNSEEIKLAYKSSYNKRRNQVILLMINDEANNNNYYFAIKNLSELNSLGWLAGKKEAIINNNNNNNNNINNNNFQNALDDALNYQIIESNPRRISKLKPYINKYNWEGIHCPAGSKEWRRFEQNNDTIALNILYAETNTKKINIVYKSKYNNKCKKQAILLMIGDGIKYHYLAVTNLSGLLQGNSSNHRGDFYCLNCFNSYTTKNKLKEHEEICNNHDSCRIEMPDWANKTIKYNPGEKSLKAPFSFFLDLECILKKLQSSQNNLEKSYTEKKARHEPSGLALYTRCSFDKNENKFTNHWGKDCIEELCKKLKESAIEVINREKKEMVTLTHEENNFYGKKIFVYTKMIKIILIEKRLKIIVIIQENLEELHIVNAIWIIKFKKKFQ